MKRKNNNKGFTLIELVVAIAVLAIVITPVLKSFVTSAKLNVKSRKLTAATNIQQSLMEGYADKTYTEILNICKKNGAGTGKYIFSTVSNNVYNSPSAWVKKPANFTELTSLASSGNNPATLYWNGTSASSNSIYIPGSAGETLYNVMFQDIQKYVAFHHFYTTHSVGDGNAETVSWWTDSTESILVMGYTNLKEDSNFKFDAIVVLVPAAEKKEDSYYPYYVNIYLYDLENIKSYLDYKQPFMTYTSGIKNVSQKGSTER